jgi:ABC-type Fe3+-hydroxamate transport system substrate-binding protein
MTLVVATLVVGAALAGGIYLLYRSETAPMAGPIHVIDDAGRNVTLAHPAQRIVALQPSVMDILFRLGLRDRVVGVDCGAAAEGGVYADYTPGQVTNWSLQNVPCIVWLPSLDIPAIVALQPDLVIGATGIAITSLDQITDTYGIATLYLNPANLSGIGHDVSLVAALTGTEATGRDLCAAMNASLSEDSQAVSNLSSRMRILLTYYADTGGYYTFGPGTFGNALVTAAGAVSITATDTQANEGEISGTYVLAADPEAIVVGVGFGWNVSSYAIGPDWADFPAVQQGHVYPIDATLISEPDPSMIFGIATLIHLLYPTLLIPVPSSGPIKG